MHVSPAVAEHTAKEDMMLILRACEHLSFLFAPLTVKHRIYVTLKYIKAGFRETPCCSGYATQWGRREQ